MATVSDLITDAQQRLGVLAAGEVPSAADMAIGYQALNTLTDAFGTRRLTIPYIQRTTAAIVPNQTSYTVGTGGDINIVRPVFITTINFIDTSQSPTLEMKLQAYTDDQYAAIPLKGLTSALPVGAYYNPTYAGMLGTLIPWPIPTKATLLWAFYHAVAVPQFSATTSTLTIPPGYYRFLVTSLAQEMIPMFPIVPDAIVQRIDRQQREAESDIKIANFRPSDCGFDPGALSGSRNVVTVASFLSGTF